MKKKKNNLISTLALLCALAALLLSWAGMAGAPEDQSHLIDDLYQENRRLQERVDALEQQLEELMTAASLQTWTLDVKAWEDSSGADVTLTAVPSAYQSGISATFLVKLDGREAASIPCTWDGTAFTATASLSAADGYRYYCILNSRSGTRQLPLAGAEEGDAGNLASGLSAYCNLLVNDWVEQPDALILTDAYAQVQLPRISNRGAVEIESARLVLRLNGAESARIPVEMIPSEVAGSCEAAITELRLPMPELGESDILELSLEVILSDGRVLTAFGATWHLEGDKLSSAVG